MANPETRCDIVLHLILPRYAPAIAHIITHLPSSKRPHGGVRCAWWFDSKAGDMRRRHLSHACQRNLLTISPMYSHCRRGSLDVLVAVGRELGSAISG